MTTINTDMKVEYYDRGIGGKTYPCRYLGVLSHSGGDRHAFAVSGVGQGGEVVRTMLKDNSCFEYDSYSFRNVQEKKKFWTVTFWRTCGPIRDLYAKTYNDDPRLIVGHSYYDGICVSIVEGEYVA